MDNKQQLDSLLAQPGKVGPEHIPMLKEMVSRFPYAQPFHLLLAKAESAAIPKAALYNRGSTLYHILNIVSEAEKDLLNEDEELDFPDDDHEVVEAEPAPADENLAALEYTAEQNHSAETQPGLSDHDIDSLSGVDFFAFEQALSTDVVPQPPVIETVVPDEPEHHRVSKYDDDQLPYTFLWWLAKTRKEHEQIFQPYVQVKPNPASLQQRTIDPQPAFQQQYVEHIFHIQTPFEVADHLAEYSPGEVKDVKGAEIIEKFLKEDPTIKPPKPEQIDTENKAKKSAEDHYDLVSETLAKIYIEQMLYHKAIDTYKKLSLKYPEKSGYFADLIQSIEKKF